MEMPFGKYKGYDISDIADRDKQYLEWLVENTDLSNSLYEEIMSYL